MYNFNKGSIHDISIKQLKKYIDERGWLCEAYRLDEIASEFAPVMSYISMTQPSTSRGPHYHQFQSDCFVFLGPGNFKIYLWDMRENSSTYKNEMIIFAGQDNPIQIIVPPKIVHAYKNISTDASGFVINFPNKLYKGFNRLEAPDEIRYEDISESNFILN